MDILKRDSYTKLLIVLLGPIFFLMCAPSIHATSGDPSSDRSVNSVTSSVISKVSPNFVPGIPTDVPAITPLSSTTLPAGLSSCFDFYQFGSIPTSLTPAKEYNLEGTDASFVGTVTNNNPYPVIDATVYVKVFRTYGTQKNIDGPDVVDWFPTKQHFSLKTGESVPLSVTWHIPSDAQPGEYQIATYVASSDRFEYQGLTFTDDVVGSLTNFTVVGNTPGAVHFDKSTVKVDQQSFHFASFPPTVSAKSSVVVSLKVANTTAHAYDGTITWTLSHWDGLLSSSVLETKTESIHIDQGASVPTSFTVTDTNHSVYYLTAELTTQNGSKSIVDIRFVRGGVNEPRISAVGVSKYPAVDGSKIYACFHSSGTAEAPDVQLELTAHKTGLAGIFGEVAETSYYGIAPGQLSALSVVLPAAASSFIINAKLYQDGHLIDAVNVPYSCTTLGVPCPFLETDTSIWVAVAALTVFVLLVIGTVWWLFTRRHSRQTTP